MLTFVYHIHSLLSHFNKKETPTVDKTMVGVGGERGIRTTGPLTVNGFSKGSCGQERRNRP